MEDTVNDNTNASPENDFFFFDVLDGRTYPEDTVDVFVDEKAVYDYAKAQRAYDAIANPTEEDTKTFSDQVEAFRERILKSQFTFFLKGISDDEVTKSREETDAHFEKLKVQRKAADGMIRRELPEGEATNYLNYFNSLVMSKHVQKIYRHGDDTTRTAPTVDDISGFMAKAPAAAKEKLANAIAALRVESTEYERALDEGFFLKS